MSKTDKRALGDGASGDIDQPEVKSEPPAAPAPAEKPAKTDKES